MFGPDVALFRWINRWPESLEPFFYFLSEGNKWDSVRAFLLVLVIVLCSFKHLRRGTLLALASWPLANGITDVLKFAGKMERPNVALSDTILRVGEMTSFGTASAHSANMAAIAFAFCYHFRWWGTPWLLVAFLTGLSRIYVGVHFPSQVLLGWACGCFASFVVIKTFEALVRLRSSERPAAE